MTQQDIHHFQRRRQTCDNEEISGDNFPFLCKDCGTVLRSIQIAIYHTFQIMEPVPDASHDAAGTFKAQRSVKGFISIVIDAAAFQALIDKGKTFSVPSVAGDLQGPSVYKRRIVTLGFQSHGIDGL